MSQTSIIAFGLLLGFVFYVSLRGELPAWQAIVFTSTSSSTAGTAATAVGTTNNIFSGLMTGGF